MRTLLSILLLGVFLYNIAGIFVVFKIQQHFIRKEIKKEIKLGVPKDELHHIQITDKNYRELSWLEDNEFMYRGQMYDVVHRKINHATSITLQCVNDTQETVLFANLEALVDETMDERHNGKNPLELIFLSFYINDSQSLGNVTHDGAGKNNPAYLKFLISDAYSAGAFQPPEFC